MRIGEERPIGERISMKGVSQSTYETSSVCLIKTPTATQPHARDHD